MAVTRPAADSDDRPPTPRRGRPPRYSREQIVNDVAEMVLADPQEPLTIGRVADAIGAAPMSLYRHFADREDLVVSVAHHLLAGARHPFDPAMPWQQQIRGWMTAVFEQAARVPQLLQFAVTGPSPAWLTDAAYLARVLEHAGFDDDQLLAEAVYWVATTTMGHALIRAMGEAGQPVHRLRDGAPALSRGDAELLGRLLPRYAAMHPHEFDRIVDLTIAALEHSLASRATSID